MPQNPRGFRDPRILAALARNYRADYQFWAEEYITAVSQLHFIRKRNLPPLFDLFQGKMHTFEVSVRAAKLGLGEVKRFVDGSRHEFVTKYNVPVYPELEDLSQKFESDFFYFANFKHQWFPMVFGEASKQVFCKKLKFATNVFNLLLLNCYSSKLKELGKGAQKNRKKTNKWPYIHTYSIKITFFCFFPLRPWKIVCQNY